MSHARSPRPLTAQALRCCFHLRQRSNLRGLLSLLQLRNPFTLIRRVAALSKNGLLLTNPRVVFVSGAHLNTAPYLGHGKGPRTTIFRKNRNGPGYGGQNQECR